MQSWKGCCMKQHQASLNRTQHNLRRHGCSATCLSLTWILLEGGGSSIPSSAKIINNSFFYFMPSMFSFDFAIALSRFLSKFFALSVLATSRRINPGSVQTTTGSNSKLGQLCSCASNACKKKADKQLQIYVTWWLLLRDVIWIHMGDVQLSI